MLAGMSEEEQKAWHEKNKVTLLAQQSLCRWLPAARLLHSAAALSQVCCGAPKQQPNTCCAVLCCAGHCCCLPAPPQEKRQQTFEARAAAKARHQQVCDSCRLPSADDACLAACRPHTQRLPSCDSVLPAAAVKLFGLPTTPLFNPYCRPINSTCGQAGVLCCAVQALSAPQKLVIDLAFSGLMTAGELKSLCQQLSYSYSIAVNGEQQMHLHLLGADGDVEAAMQKQLTGHVHWSVTKSEKGFKDFFQVKVALSCGGDCLPWHPVYIQLGSEDSAMCTKPGHGHGMCRQLFSSFPVVSALEQQCIIPAVPCRAPPPFPPSCTHRTSCRTWCT